MGFASFDIENINLEIKEQFVQCCGPNTHLALSDNDSFLVVVFCVEEIAIV